jgi:hypothetical protein
MRELADAGYLDSRQRFRGNVSPDHGQTTVKIRAATLLGWLHVPEGPRGIASNALEQLEQPIVGEFMVNLQ